MNIRQGQVVARLPLTRVRAVVEPDAGHDVGLSRTVRIRIRVR